MSTVTSKKSNKTENAPATPVSATATQTQLPGVKPPNDVIAGAAARACSQSTIHPIDTIKVRMQSGSLTQGGSLLSTTKSLYRGVGGAAGGAGIAIGAYYAFYGASLRFLRDRGVPIGSAAFAAGAAGAIGSSVVKVPLAVCIRSVQAGVYPHFFAAMRDITKAAGLRGLYTGYVPTVLEDVPDMAVKFMAYELLRATHMTLSGRGPEESDAIADLVIGGGAGAIAAAVTTPFDVVKTRMMCAAAETPSIRRSVAQVMQTSGVRGFFSGVGPRAISSAINSAFFFMFFEAIRSHLEQRDRTAKARAAMVSTGPQVRRRPYRGGAVSTAPASMAVVNKESAATLAGRRGKKARGTATNYEGAVAAAAVARGDAARPLGLAGATLTRGFKGRKTGGMEV